MESFSTFSGVRRVIARLETSLRSLEATVSSLGNNNNNNNNSNLLQGIGSPNGTLTVNGPAFYFDTTDPNNPTLWLKPSAGTNSNWINGGKYSNA